MLVEVALGVALGAGFLYVFYRALEVGWPASYFSVSSSIESGISVSPWRYALFRAAPVFLVLVFVKVSVDRAGSNGTSAAVLVGLIHTGLTHGTALIGLFSRRATADPYRNPLIVLNVCVAALVAATTLAAIMLADQMRPIIPPLDAVASDLWTAVGAAVLGAYLAKVVTAKAQAGGQVSARSHRTIPRTLWELARSEAVANGTDPELVLAIMVAENLQRPPWFRRLERIKGWFWPEGTYGVMQVHSERPISDEESIRLAVSGRLKGLRIPMSLYGDQAFVDHKALRHVIMQYNPDPRYADTVSQIVSELRSSIGSS